MSGVDPETADSAVEQVLSAYKDCVQVLGCDLLAEVKGLMPACQHVRGPLVATPPTGASVGGPYSLAVQRGKSDCVRWLVALPYASALVRNGPTASP
jgi:hypothetical protein